MNWKEFFTGKAMDSKGNRIKQGNIDENNISSSKLEEIEDIPKMILVDKAERHRKASEKGIATERRRKIKKVHLPSKLMRIKEYNIYKSSLAKKDEMPIFLEVVDLVKK